jgi:adenylate cyclase
MRGRELWEGMGRGSAATRQLFEKVRALVGEALALDPGYARAHAFMSILHTVDLANRITGAPDALALAEASASRALELNPDEPLAHNAIAIIALHRKDLDAAQAAAEAAIRINPNFANGYGTLGHVLVYRGNPLSAVPHLERAMRLDPVFAQQYRHFLGLAYLVAGHWQTAAEALRERIRLVPQTDLSRAMLAAALGGLGDGPGARRVCGRGQAADPPAES